MMLGSGSGEVGAPGTRKITFDIISTGEAEAELYYCRPWECEQTANGSTLVEISAL